MRRARRVRRRPVLMSSPGRLPSSSSRGSGRRSRGGSRSRPATRSRARPWLPSSGISPLAGMPCLRRERATYDQPAPRAAAPFTKASTWSEAAPQRDRSEGFLALQQLERGAQLLLAQLVGAADVQRGMLRLGEQRGVGDLDRVVGDGDAPVVALQVERVPADRGVRERLRVPDQQVRAPLERHAEQRTAADERRDAAQPLPQRLEVRDEGGVDRPDDARGRERGEILARERDDVVGTLREQRLGVVPGPEVVHVDPAAGLILERDDPGVLRVALTREHPDHALGRRQPVRRHRRRRRG